MEVRNGNLKRSRHPLSTNSDGDSDGLKFPMIPTPTRDHGNHGEPGVRVRRVRNPSFRNPSDPSLVLTPSHNSPLLDVSPTDPVLDRPYRELMSSDRLIRVPTPGPSRRLTVSVSFVRRRPSERRVVAGRQKRDRDPVSYEKRTVGSYLQDLQGKL